MLLEGDRTGEGVLGCQGGGEQERRRPNLVWIGLQENGKRLCLDFLPTLRDHQPHQEASERDHRSGAGFGYGTSSGDHKLA